MPTSARPPRWDVDRVAAGATQCALGLAGSLAAGWICALAATVALALLLPLKRVDPFVIRVDNTTGIVDVVPVYTGQGPLDETVTRYFLTHYVTSASASTSRPRRVTTRSAARFTTRSATRPGMRYGSRVTRIRR